MELHGHVDKNKNLSHLFVCYQTKILTEFFESPNMAIKFGCALKYLETMEMA